MKLFPKKYNGIWNKWKLNKVIPYGYIYITTNNIDGMRYIGQKKINRNWKNYLGSGLILTRAIEKYGKENFSKSIIDIAYSKNELDLKEEYYINFFDAVNSKDYYNLQLGGNTAECTEEIKEKIRQSHIGLLVGEKHPFYGKHHTDESRKKMSESLRGRVSPNKGKPMSEEQKEKLKESWKHRKVTVSNHTVVRCIETNQIYESVKEASRQTKIHTSNIFKAMCGKCKTAGGYHWERVV